MTEESSTPNKRKAGAVVPPQAPPKNHAVLVYYLTTVNRDKTTAIHYFVDKHNRAMHPQVSKRYKRKLRSKITTQTHFYMCKTQGKLLLFKNQPYDIERFLQCLQHYRSRTTNTNTKRTSISRKANKCNQSDIHRPDYVIRKPTRINTTDTPRKRYDPRRYSLTTNI